MTTARKPPAAADARGEGRNATPRKPRPASPTERSAARNARAARILGGIALDAAHAGMLADIIADSGETAASWVRRMIREHAPNRPPHAD